MIHIGDDALPNPTAYCRDQGDAAGRHVGDLTRKFLPPGKHITSFKIEAHTLKLSAVNACGWLRQCLFCGCHHSLAVRKSAVGNRGLVAYQRKSIPHYQPGSRTHYPPWDYEPRPPNQPTPPQPPGLG